MSTHSSKSSQLPMLSFTNCTSLTKTFREPQRDSSTLSEFSILIQPVTSMPPGVTQPPASAPHGRRKTSRPPTRPGTSQQQTIHQLKVNVEDDAGGAQVSPGIPGGQPSPFSGTHINGDGQPVRRRKVETQV